MMSIYLYDITLLDLTCLYLDYLTLPYPLSLTHSLSNLTRHYPGMPLGGHAVKMIGWGVDEGVPFWTCVNSWNNLWGEGGTFRIVRGVNECGIESMGVAGEV